MAFRVARQSVNTVRNGSIFRPIFSFHTVPHKWVKGSNIANKSAGQTLLQTNVHNSYSNRVKTNRPTSLLISL